MLDWINRIVPALLLTILRSYPSSLFISMLLPALGLPTMATLTPLRIILPAL